MCSGLPCWVYPGLVGWGSLRARTLVCIWPPSSQSFVPCLLGRDLTMMNEVPAAETLRKEFVWMRSWARLPRGSPPAWLTGLCWEADYFGPKLSHHSPRTERLEFFWQLLARSEPRGLNLFQGWEPAAPWSEKGGISRERIPERGKMAVEENEVTAGAA